MNKLKGLGLFIIGFLWYGITMYGFYYHEPVYEMISVLTGVFGICSTICGTQILSRKAMEEEQ